MTLGRAAGAMFIASLLAGSLNDPDPGPAAAPQRSGEYWVLAADLHVHGFFGDGALPPWEIRAGAAST